MEYDEDKVDEMILALLHLTTFKDGMGMRAWKGHHWSAMERLYKRGYISDPQNDGGRRAKAQELFEKHFLRKV